MSEIIPDMFVPFICIFFYIYQDINEFEMIFANDIAYVSLTKYNNDEVILRFI